MKKKDEPQPELFFSSQSGKSYPYYLEGSHKWLLIFFSNYNTTFHLVYCISLRELGYHNNVTPRWIHLLKDVFACACVYLSRRVVVSQRDLSFSLLPPSCLWPTPDRMNLHPTSRSFRQSAPNSPRASSDLSRSNPGCLQSREERAPPQTTCVVKVVEPLRPVTEGLRACRPPPGRGPWRRAQRWHRGEHRHVFHSTASERAHHLLCSLGYYEGGGGGGGMITCIGRKRGK